MAITATRKIESLASPVVSVAVSPTAIGNCLVLAVTTFVSPATAAPALPSGGGVTNWRLAFSTTDGGSVTTTYFYGKVTSTVAAQTLTIGYSGTIGASTVEVSCWELSDGGYRDWSCTGTGPRTVGASSTTITFPSILSATSTGNQAYFGYNQAANSSVTTTVGGFTETVTTTGSGNGTVFGAVASNTTATPTITGGQSPAGVASASGIILLAETPQCPIFDAKSENTATFVGGANASWTHTPVGTPKGVAVVIVQEGTTDQITAVTYGGVAMTRVIRQINATAELGTVYIYFLGTGIPTGAQTVAITRSGANNYAATATTVTCAAGDTVADVSAGADQGVTANPSLAITTVDESLLAYGVFTGLAAPVSTVATDTVHEFGNDYGADGAMWAYKQAAAAFATSIGYTAAADDICHAAVAIRADTKPVPARAAPLAGAGPRQAVARGASW